MWMLAKYRPTGIFSLKSSATTSSGAKTLLVPTMYAVKMALVDAAFRSGEDGERVFEEVKELVSPDVAARLNPNECYGV
jgi:hypothetical protein